MHPSRLVPLIVLAVVPAVAVGACYGATEVAIEITTDRACSGELKTAIYRGDYRISKNPPSAVVAGCPGAAAGAGESAVGSIVLVPSGSRSEEATVTVVMRVDGKDPDACLEGGAAKDACILATRAFRYIEHASLTIPVLLSDACRGVECKAGETCSGGACVDQHVPCDRGTCDLPPSEADAGPDAGALEPVADAAPDGSAPIVCGVPKDGQTPRFVAASGKKFYYADATTLYSVSREGTTQEFPSVGALGTASKNIEITALTSRKGLWGIGTLEPGDDGGQQAFVRGPGVQPVSVELPRVDSLAIAPDTQDAYAVSNQGDGVVHIRADHTVEVWLTGKYVPPVAADVTAVYVTDGKWIYARGRTNDSPPSSLRFGPGESGSGGVIFASNDTHVFAAGYFQEETDAGSRPAAWQIRKLAPPPPPVLTSPGVEVKVLAADADYVYWSAPNSVDPTSQTIHRKALEVNAGPVGIDIVQTLPIPNASTLEHLTVNDDCVYYWTTSVSGGAQLRASPKTGFQ